MRARPRHTTELLERRVLLAAAPPTPDLTGGPDSAWTRHISGNSTGETNDVAVDADGNVLSTGFTTGSGLEGAINSPGGGGSDAFVSKLSGDGTMLWSMYLGGSAGDSGGGVATDAAGNVYVTGATSSTNFPGALNAPLENGSAFVAKLSPAGAVLWSLYVGGTGSESGSDIAIDAGGNPVITGSTNSVDLPAFNQPFGQTDIFVAKVQSTGQFMWAYYLGGGGNDTAGALALDATGAAYVTGQTVSTNFVNANNPYPANHQTVAIVARVTPEGPPSWSTYLNLLAPSSSIKRTGGSGLALDASGDIYVSGARAVGASGVGTPYVAKVAAAGTQDWVTGLVSGNFSDPESAADIVSDADGNTLVAGSSRGGSQLPAAINTASTGYDAWVAKLNSAGTVVWSKYIGGTDEDQARSIASADGGSTAVIGGWTRSTNMPDALNPYGGNGDGFVARVPIIPVAPAALGATFDVNVSPHRLLVSFNQNLYGTLTADDLILTNLTTGQTVPSSAIAAGFDLFNRRAAFTFPGLPGGLLGDGRYRATLPAASVTNPGGLPMAQDFVFSFVFIRGDATLDGRVNLDDFSILAANFGLANRTFTQGNFNYDGRVNLLDFNLLATHFGREFGPTGLRADSQAGRDADADDEDEQSVLRN